MDEDINILRDPKYSSDEIFQYINKNFVTLQDEEIKNNTDILKEILLFITISYYSLPIV